MAPSTEKAPEPAGRTTSEAYGWYALGVLVIVYALNFIDRQLLTILAVDIKRDLGIGDQDFGFLYGTAFAVFYALFGIPLGKLADRWSRTRLLAIGLALWSAMTALSGLSRSFGELAAARIGVGVGEATAGPTGYSLLSDYFPPRRRATAVAIFSSGIYLGGGLSLFIGAAITGGWNGAFPHGSAPFGLAGWQVALLAVGLPGLLLALWVGSLLEPIRGRYDTAGAPPTPASGGSVLRDVGAIVPPFTALAAARRGPRALVANLILAAATALAAWLLTRWLGDPAQWVALAVGVYAVASWATALRHDDAEAYDVIWRQPSVVGLNLGYGLTCVVSYAMAAFGPLYAIREFAAPQGAVALIVGGSAAAGGALGVIAGGALGDRLAKPGHNARRIAVVIAALLLSVVPNVVMLVTHSVTVFYLAVFPTWFILSAALGGAAGALVNIVPSQVRATATAAFFLGATMIGLALGPYAAGRASSEFGSLRLGLASVLVVVPFALAALLFAWHDCRRRGL